MLFSENKIRIFLITRISFKDMPGWNTNRIFRIDVVLLYIFISHVQLAMTFELNMHSYFSTVTLYCDCLIRKQLIYYRSLKTLRLVQKQNNFCSYCSQTTLKSDTYGQTCIEKTKENTQFYQHFDRKPSKEKESKHKIALSLTWLFSY